MEGEGKPWGNFNPVRQYLHWSGTLSLTKMERWPVRAARNGELIIEGWQNLFLVGWGLVFWICRDDGFILLGVH